MTESSSNRWYRENAKEFNRRRRARYAEDLPYREKAIENSRAAYRKIREKHPASVSNRGSGFIKRDPVPLEDFGILDAYDLEQAAIILGMKAVTLRYWILKRIIPDPRMYTGRRKIFFPIHYLRRIISLWDILAPSHKLIGSDFSERMWNDTNIMREKDMARTQGLRK